MVTLKDIIVMSMKDYGYELVDYEPKDYLFFNREGSFIIVAIMTKEINGDDVIKFYRDLEQYVGTKIMACLEGYKKDAEIQAERLNIILETKNDIINDLGTYLYGLVTRGDDEKIKKILNMDVEVEEEAEETEDQESIPIFLENTEIKERRIINPVLTKDKAIDLSRRKVQGFDAKMILTPYIVFEYKAEVQIEGNMIPKKVFGRVGISTVNGKVKYIKTGLNVVSDLKIPYETEEQNISFDEAETAIREELINHYTKEEEIKIEKETVTIIERRNSRPKENTLSINSLGVYYWPYWIVSGPRGKIKIDAVEGDIVEEHFL
ncbi:MAG: hypothetical protein ACP5SF_02615 [Thermoplasmata archaeon]